jgi:hypothetical protein
MAILEEESPYVFCERWFRRTERKLRSGVSVGNNEQKRSKNPP